MGLKLDDAAEGAGLAKGEEGQEVSIPASVLVDADEAVRGLGEGYEGFGEVGGGDEGFFEENMFVSLEG